MASEIRVDKINSLSGVGTVTLSPTGVDIAGITTAATLRATTGIVTSLTAGSLTSLGAVSGTTGTFSGDVDIADKIVHTGDTDTAIRFSGADTIQFETGGSSRLQINSSGHTVAGGDLFADADLYMIDYLKHTGDTNTSIRFPAADTISAETNGAERLRIDSSGRLLLGTTTQNNNAPIQVTTTNQVVATFESTGNDPQIYLGDDMSSPTDNCIILGYDRADNRGYLTVGGDADNVFTIKNGGDVEIGVGNLKFASGKGIDFSATGDGSGTDSSELLDDYEEGTWTPSQTGGTINGTSIQLSGYYTKVGRLVHIAFKAQSTSHDIEVPNYVQYGGLPYTASENGTGVMMTEDGEIVARQGQWVAGGTSILINACGSSSGTTAIRGTLVYHTT